ncbi:MAG: AraC family transcriptional regulator [Lachnospiraceae bacterium]|nr:AraC family transcriptional regulator [Ruminococcus sp.]MCM1274765.1 AraC family transcriptional regulator [Lachnospiraceae bacterium]
MESYFFPIIEREKNLPYYVTCIGEADPQPLISRPDGYLCPQIILCSEGSGILQTEGMERQITAGTAFFLPAGAPHNYFQTDNTWRTHYVSFAGYSAEILLRQLGLTEPGVFPVDLGIMRSIFQRMISILKSDKFYGGFTASAILYEYMIELNHQIIGTESRFASESASLTPVLNYIDTHYSEVIELGTLCELIQVTPQYLCRLFRKRLGMRPLEYITQRRIQQAKVYLREGEKTIKEIALEVGYADAGYFSAVFKRSEGVSPRRYIRREL